MTDSEHQRLVAAIESIASKIARYRGRTIGEQNTKASLIEPLLEALGWDTRDLDEVHREFKAKKSDKPVDYALQMLKRPRLFIEAKGLGENLSDRRWIGQVLSYATVAGVTWCVLTDGDEYRFYNATAPVDAEEKLFCKIRLSNKDAAELAKTLELVSRSNLEGNLLDIYWKSHFVDRRVLAAIRQQFDNATAGLVRLVRGEVADLSPREIAESIRRLDVRIEPPPAWNRGPQQQGAGEIPRRKKSLVSRSGKKGKRTEFGVGLKELIDAKMVEVPLALFRKYKGKRLQATLLPDGSVEFQGKAFSTCSRAAERARETVTGKRMNTNGWSFWQFTDSDGKTRELLDARAAYLSQKASDEQ